MPEFYLRRWCDDAGTSVRYLRVATGDLHSRRVTPGGIGFETDLYTLPIDYSHNVETDLFQLVDSFGATAVSRLIADGDLRTHSDRQHFIVFVTSLPRRHPDALKLAADDIAKKLPEFPQLNEAARFGALIRLFHLPGGGETAEALLNMDWKVMDLSAGTTSLLTSDQPTLFCGGTETPTGILDRPFSRLESVAFPLTPTKLFIAKWKNRTIELERRSPTQIAKFMNGPTVGRARKFVIARDTSQDSYIRKHFSTWPDEDQ